ncbi:dephospho-CoA kinase [Apibacter muscae]|uniref:Dephospho-CoA kinase n=1 Tax=Apibacter muscae TaxID=2509004 RepID=A0A563D9N7_9FLAO|nr:dephospho-CoA kinase [Apibacter muscae]TWP22759.1 dephospho-CoA kinase [Apibacter muscae]TWP26631.1 dephospho-CoA kinase [Apibacter muscae]TWP28205.1 dephospho-CoA kinase [Apibacter muscae]
MFIVGLTGGMGVGKSTVANIFNEQGYPVYNSDSNAKILMIQDCQLKSKIIDLLGPNAYIGDDLNRKFIADQIFSNPELLRKQNLIVHEAVKNDFAKWISTQESKICIKESAILFESGSYLGCDATIAVIASEKIRLKRIMQRDGWSLREINDRLKNQWSQEKIKNLTNFCIVNDADLENLKSQVQNTIEKLKTYFKLNV